MARPLLFIAWSLVLWGTFVGLATLWLAGTDGVPAAWAALTWLNLGAAVVAILVWACAAIVWARLRHSRQAPGSEGSDQAA